MRTRVMTIDLSRLSLNELNALIEQATKYRDDLAMKIQILIDNPGSEDEEDEKKEKKTKSAAKPIQRKRRKV